MTTPRSHDGELLCLIVRDAEGHTYKIPADDLTRYEMPAAESDRIKDYLWADGDTEGFAARVSGLGDWNVKPVLGRPLPPQGGGSVGSAASELWDLLSR
jgi:hypothetical protein